MGERGGYILEGARCAHSKEKKSMRFELRELNFQCWRKEAGPPSPAFSFLVPLLGCCSRIPALSSPSLSEDVISPENHSFLPLSITCPSFLAFTAFINIGNSLLLIDLFICILSVPCPTPPRPQTQNVFLTSSITWGSVFRRDCWTPPP